MTVSFAVSASKGKVVSGSWPYFFPFMQMLLRSSVLTEAALALHPFFLSHHPYRGILLLKFPPPFKFPPEYLASFPELCCVPPFLSRVLCAHTLQCARCTFTHTHTHPTINWQWSSLARLTSGARDQRATGDFSNSVKMAVVKPGSWLSERQGKETWLNNTDMKWGESAPLSCRLSEGAAWLSAASPVSPWVSLPLTYCVLSAQATCVLMFLPFIELASQPFNGARPRLTLIDSFSERHGQRNDNREMITNVNCFGFLTGHYWDFTGTFKSPTRHDKWVTFLHGIKVISHQYCQPLNQGEGKMDEENFVSMENGRNSSKTLNPPL